MCSEDYDLERVKYFKSLKKFSKRYYESVPEMSNTLNWVITLVTALFFYFMNNLSGNLNYHNSCFSVLLNSWFIVLSVILFILLVILFLYFKLTFIKLRKEMDILLSNEEINKETKPEDIFNLEPIFNNVDLSFKIGMYVSSFSLFLFTVYFLIKYFFV